MIEYINSVGEKKDSTFCSHTSSPVHGAVIMTSLYVKNVIMSSIILRWLVPIRTASEQIFHNTKDDSNEVMC